MDSNNLLLTTDYPIDKIIGYKSGSYESTWDINTTSISHGFDFIPLYYLQWSTNASFEPTYSETFTGYGNNPNCYCYVNSSTVFLNGNPGTNTTTRTIYYRIYFFMPPDINIGLAASSQYFENFILNTDYNYSKILLEGVTSSGNSQINHDLGYYPQTEFWWILDLPTYGGRVITRSTRNIMDIDPENIQVNTSSVITTSSRAIGCYYRIYADAAQ